MFIASASTTVKFHEFPTGNVVHNYQPGTKVEGPIRSISWSKDGNWLALVPYLGVTEIISVKDQLKLIKTIQDVEEPSCAAFQNTTKKFIALGTKNGQVLIYDIKTRSTKKIFPRTSSFITHVDFTAKDTHCVAGCKNGDVLLYSNLTHNISCTFRVPKSNSVTCLQTNRNKRNLILGGSNEGVVVVWDTNINKSKFFVEAHNAPITSVAFSPVNSDLIVSTGADRQFSFYDIVDNKCITSVIVENNITAVDFSSDGTYCVMASYNGKVYLYDTRNIQEPVHSFQAHKSAIKHLAFQNISETKSSSTCSISTDSITPVQSCEELSNRNSDLFGFFAQVPSSDMTDSIKTSANSNECGDSFIVALGLDKNNTAESNKYDDDSVFYEGAKKNLETKINTTDLPPPNAPKTLCEELGSAKIKSIQHASTPKYLSENFLFNFSPSISNQTGNPATSVTITDLQTVTREAVKNEIRSALDEIRAEIKYQATHVTYQTRRMVLGLQMAMVKEFIKVENYCNSIRDDIISDSPAENNCLVEENEQLKKRIEFLEQHIANLTLNQNGSLST